MVKVTKNFENLEIFEILGAYWLRRGLPTLESMPSFDFVLVKQKIKTISAGVKHMPFNVAALAISFFAMLGALVAPRRREVFA